MKKLLGVFLMLIVVYAIYYDLTAGTIPLPSSPKAEALTKVEQVYSLPYFEAQVEPGETVLTIVEHQVKKPIPVSIEKLIQDFQKLNNGQAAEKIQIGKTYKFPDYTK